MLPPPPWLLPRALTEKINKKNKHAGVKPFMVKNHLWVFLSCNIENPAFDSQVRGWGESHHTSEKRWRLSKCIRHHPGTPKKNFSQVDRRGEHCYPTLCCVQTKENLTLRASSFGSKCELPQPFIDKVAKSGVVDSILQVGGCDELAIPLEMQLLRLLQTLQLACCAVGF